MSAQLQTYSSPVTWALDDLNSVAVPSGKAYVLSTTGRSFSMLKLSTGVGAAAVALYDARDISGVKPGTKKWLMDAGTGVPDINVLINPLVFKIGLVAVLEQGSNNNPVLSVAIPGDI